MTGPHDGRVGAAAEVAVAAPAMSSPPGSGGPGVPLTERILSRLPGPRPAWMLVWALVPWLNLVAVSVSGAADWAGTAAIPVILMSAVTPVRMPPTVTFLPKPFDLDRLTSLVDRLLA